VSHFLLLLWIFAKSTFTSFAGLASLPEIREELVAQRHWITDDQLSQAIVITRTTPGPVGVLPIFCTTSRPDTTLPNTV